MIDYTDANELFKFSFDNVDLAKKYKEARQKYAQAKFALHVALAKAYREGKIPQSTAMDKALLILAEGDSKQRSNYSDHILRYEEFRGLEALLKAREGHISLAQSLIKNQKQNT